MFRKHLFKITILISILLHLLLFLFFKKLSRIQLFPSQMEELLENNKQDEKRLVFDLIETPDDARSEKPPESADLVSDKSSIARDKYQKNDKSNGNPYSEGELDFKDYPLTRIAPSNFERENNSAEENNKQEDGSEKEFTYQKFSRQQLMKNSPAAPEIQQQQDRPLYENRKFSAKDLGGFSFNTYNWNFAPYMLAMKKKVERNIFPPPAFTHMGLISGETLVRFKVMPNGEVKDLAVLKYTGHESLKETSVQAILNSSKFRPLPSDFPEDYLEVTAFFTYYVRRH